MPGIGFFISGERHILTARHVVGRDEDWRCDEAGRPDGRKVQVLAFNTSTERAQEITQETRNVRTSPNTDIALVKVQGSGQDAVDKINTCEPSGEVVALVWRREDSGPIALSGTIQPNAESFTGGLVMFDVSVGRIARGDSGSPVFNRKGELVGILQGMGDDARVGFFVPIADAKNLLFNVVDIRPCNDADDGRVVDDLKNMIESMQAVIDKYKVAMDHLRADYAWSAELRKTRDPREAESRQVMVIEYRERFDDQYDIDATRELDISIEPILGFASDGQTINKTKRLEGGAKAVTIDDFREDLDADLRRFNRENGTDYKAEDVKGFEVTIVYACEGGSQTEYERTVRAE